MTSEDNNRYNSQLSYIPLIMLNSTNNMLILAIITSFDTDPALPMRLNTNRGLTVR